MSIGRTSLLLGVALMAGGVAVACDKNDEPTPPRTAPPALQSAAPAKSSELRLSLASGGEASFLIDAPLEKIKGVAKTFRGALSLDPDKLASLRGQVEADLGTLVTSSFEDQEKNGKQTEHARNWLELGGDVDAKARAENQWARFIIRSVKEKAGALSAATQNADRREVELSVEGDFWLHGVTAPKSATLIATFEGPADALRSVSFRTVEPFHVSLREHDVKPRDVAGTFLIGALERVGDKIVDDVQISLAFSAQPEHKP